MNVQLSKCTKLTQLNTTAVAAATDLTPTYDVDMQGFEGCLFMVSFGTITSGAATSIKIQQSSDDGSSDAYSDLEGTSVTVADDDDNTMFYIDVYKPRKRYLRLLVLRATQNSVVNCIIAQQYGPRVQPTTHDSTTVQGGETHSSPAEGTA